MYLMLVSTSVLVPSLPSDVSDLVPSCLVSSIPTKFHVLPYHQLPKSGIQL